MASVYQNYIDDIETGDYIYPYHVHSIYQILTSRDLKNSPFPKIEEDNETIFSGSVSVGSSSVNNPGTGQVERNSRSFVAGKDNTVTSETSFVFGKNSNNIDIDNAISITNGKSSKIVYNKSIKTEANSGQNILDLEYKNDSANHINIVVIGIETFTDGVRFWGYWRFRCFLLDDTIQDTMVVDEEKPETFRASQVDVFLDNNQNGKERIVLEDQRGTGNTIFWSSHVSVAGRNR